MRRFSLWALARMEAPVQTTPEGVYTLDVPDGWRDELDGADHIRFAFNYEAPAHETAVEILTPGSPLPAMLVRRLIDAGIIRHRNVCGQPGSVHEITGPMFAAYRVDGGGVSMAGCRLEDRAFLRLSSAATDEQASAAHEAKGVFLDAVGNVVSESDISAIGLMSTESNQTPPRVKPQRLIRWVDWILREATDGNSLVDFSGVDPAAMSHAAGSQRVDIIWSKYASGKLRFAVGDATCDVPFRGWARHLEPPAITCPQTAEKTFHLGTTSDGRLAAAEQIATCSVTGQRMLERELVRCSVTGQFALPEYAGTCHVTGRPAISDRLVECEVCRQPTHPESITSSTCDVCRRLETASASDPRLGRVLDVYPGLDGWRRWKMAESLRSYVMTASRLLTRLLIVVDKQSLEVSRVATGSRLRSGWSEVSDARRGEILS